MTAEYLYYRTKKGNYPPYEYVYDEYFDCVVCPENQVLSYTTPNRDGYREFKSKSYICEKCPTKHLCTENQKNEKTVTKHIWRDYLETGEDIRYTPEYKDLYERQKETIERVFADAKKKARNAVHSFPRLILLGLRIHRWNRLHPNDYFAYIYLIFNHRYFKTLNLV